MNDEINFFYWKSVISKTLSPEVIIQPYNFLQSKAAKKDQMGSTVTDLSVVILKNAEAAQKD